MVPKSLKNARSAPGRSRDGLPHQPCNSKVDFGRKKVTPEGDFRGEAGRPSGSKMVVFGSKLSKNHEKVDPGEGSEKVQKNDGKMMPEVGVLGR